MDDRLEAGKAALLDRAAGLSRGRLDEEFLRQYWERVAAADIAGRDPVDLYGAALAHSRLAAGRPEGTPAVAVYTPVFEDHGWASSHSVVEAVTDDMPFLVDSVSLELSRRGVGMHLVAHPVIGGVAFIHVEIDRQADRAATVALAEAVARVLDGVRVVVDDWEPMRARALAVAAELEAHPPAGAAPDAVSEACDFLRWAADDRFVFMGYRRPGDGDGGDEGDGLGLFRPGRGGPAEDRLTPEPGGLLVLTRSEHDSPVHRPGALDVIAVGDQRFVGLYTSVLQKAPTTTIPVVRRTVAAVIERAGFAPGGHDAKALVDVLEAYPRRELFELDAGELYETATGILALSQRQRVRLFARRDRYRRFWSCLVFVPLDRYTQAVRRRITDVLMADLAGTGFEYSAQVGDSVLVRLHFVIHTPDGAARPDLDLIESRVAEAARSWTDDLSAAFLEAHGEEAGLTLLARYADAFPPGYRDDVPARVTVADAERVEQLAGDADIGLALTHPVDSPDGTLRFKVFRRHHPVPLSDVMPILENMGVSAVDQRPYEIKPAGAGPVWLHDFGLRTGDGRDVVVAELRGPFTDAFAAVWRGDAENDGFNRLVAAAGLDWREVSVLRAYARYLRQVGTAFSQGYMETALIANPHISRLLVELFRARFDPVGQPDPDDAASVHTKRLEAGIDAVASLDEDRILRSFLALVQATVRTNFFAGFAHGSLLAFKFDPQGVPGMPLPRPRNEIFVCSPTVEGTHLRGGKVSRGGIRWSDRREDFRTEILGLMKAQMVKNTVIVPVGAKGGFVVKSPVAPGGAPGPPTPSRERVAECYRAFVSGLLELTDNNVAGEVECPAGVVAYDSDAPYLVVAADKGTATFSDLANSIAQEY
ncbi:MAG: NAD-glutamate dehydrogenase domain-containing protein, partial [Acidimicrobiia bacterium]